MIQPLWKISWQLLLWEAYSNTYRINEDLVSWLHPISGNACSHEL